MRSLWCGERNRDVSSLTVLQIKNNICIRTLVTPLEVPTLRISFMRKPIAIKKKFYKKKV